MCLPCHVARDRAAYAALETPVAPWLDRELLDLDIDRWVTDQLLSIGLLADETTAQLIEIPTDVLVGLPDSAIMQVRVGGLPKNGFGLAGLPGSGKTQAVAALLRLLVTNNLRSTAAARGLRPVSKIKWISWPSTVCRWRLDPLNDSLREQVDHLTWVKLLVLDDLGRETRKNYEEDRVAGILDMVISERDRAGLPTIWTSNLEEDALVEMYGASTYRRLTRLNPVIRPEGLGLWESNNA